MHGCKEVETSVRLFLSLKLVLKKKCSLVTDSLIVDAGDVGFVMDHEDDRFLGSDRGINSSRRLGEKDQSTNLVAKLSFGFPSPNETKQLTRS